ncbi:energy-coupling factor transporter transmembrane component T family protein [Nitrincola schmidtii]|uniref:energy-coupling factor transporter transmembrane component T family protein n=1 Tax=Nitrincola schmidtii TaxID=1730894 RepID=UPI00124EE1EA|nr:energy-coupling factor transporter transmembrane component T [Nitrincola schmidtii]
MISLYMAHPSWLHRLPAGYKLLGLMLLSILLYPVANLVLMALMFLLTLILYASVGKPAIRQLILLKPLAPLFLLIFLMQSWSVGWLSASLLVLRMLVLILLANLITLTTRMDDMMAAIAPMFAPLKLFNIDPKRIAFAVTLLIRFVPVLMAVIQHLMEAWRARGGKRQVWKLAIPLTIQSIRLSDHVAEALAARGGISTISNPRVSNHESR